jgi:hypothetical protein
MQFKKHIVTLLALQLCIVPVVNAQGFLNKVKDKARSKMADKAETKADDAKDDAADGAKSKAGISNNSSADVASNNDGKTDDPAAYGKVLLDHIERGPEGMTVPFLVSEQVLPSGQLSAKYSYGNDYYSYADGAITKGGSGAMTVTSHITKNSEGDNMGVDLTQSIYLPASMRTGPSIVESTPGKYTCKFQGKTFATYMMMLGMKRNADSTVVMTLGTTDGKKYVVKTSNGQEVELPKYASMTYISPDGSHSGALIQNATAADAMTNAKATLYITGLPPVNLNSYTDKTWLHNSGTVFAIDGSNSKLLKANDQPYHTFDDNIEQANLFISNDTKRMCWYDGRKLHFSDGKVFNCSSAHRVFGKKETIVFTAWNDSKIYLCAKEL